MRRRIDTRSDEPALVAERVELAEAALANFDGAAVVKLHETEVAERLPELLPHFRERPGRAHLYLDIETNDGAVTRVRASDEFRIAPSEGLAAAVTTRLGAGRLRLVRF